MAYGTHGHLLLTRPHILLSCRETEAQVLASYLCSTPREELEGGIPLQQYLGTWVTMLSTSEQHTVCLRARRGHAMCTPSQCPQFSPRGHGSQQLHPADMPPTLSVPQSLRPSACTHVWGPPAPSLHALPLSDHPRTFAHAAAWDDLPPTCHSTDVSSSFFMQGHLRLPVSAGYSAGCLWGCLRTRCSGSCCAGVKLLSSPLHRDRTRGSEGCVREAI